MSGYGANPVFFNKKKKDWTPGTLANPPPPTSNNISFLPYPPTPLKVYVICTSFLAEKLILNNKWRLIFRLYIDFCQFTPKITKLTS